MLRVEHAGSSHSALSHIGKSPTEEQVCCSRGWIGPDLLLHPQSPIWNEFLDPGSISPRHCAPFHDARCCGEGSAVVCAVPEAAFWRHCQETLSPELFFRLCYEPTMG